MPNTPLHKKRLEKKASSYALIDGILYKKSFTFLLLRCLSISEANYVLREIHKGVCGNHLRGRALAQKALRQGFFWPTMRKDATNLVQKCDKRQRFAKSLMTTRENIQTNF